MARRLILLLTCVAVPALADEPTAEFRASLSREQIAAMMHTDVAGERLSVIPFATMGGATLIGGGLLLGTDSKLAQGAAWPLLTVGALEVIGGLVFALLPPAKTALKQAEVEKHVKAALALAKKKKIEGKAVTPFLLGEMVERTKGKTLAANLALLENNARYAAKIAVAFGWR